MKKILNKSKRLFLTIIVIFLTITLALFVWAVATQRLDLRKRASSGEPSICPPVNKKIIVTPEGGDGLCHNIQTAVHTVDGDGYTIEIKPGIYDQRESVVVNSKSNIIIIGSPGLGINATTINFSENSWGFLIQNSSGSISWLNIQGGSANGMLSIQDSNNFSVGYVNINSQNSHTIDVQRSNGVTIYNSNISSSAGAVEVWSVNGFGLNNNFIHDSANAVTVEGADINIVGNLILNNTGSALILRGLYLAHIENNTILFSGSNQHIAPAVELDGSGNSNMHFNNNIVAFNEGPGIYFNSYQNFTRFAYNNFYNQTTSTFPNYVDMADQTGVLGNISADPLINLTPNYGYCLYSNSPSLYTIEGNSRYMGYIGSCGTHSASPSPSPTSKIGDVNNDNKVNLIDIGIVIDNYDSINPTNPRADVDGNGKVNLIDIGLIIDRYE